MIKQLYIHVLFLANQNFLILICLGWIQRVRRHLQYLTISSEIEKDADSTFDNWWKGYFISSTEDDKLQKYLIQLKLFVLNMSYLMHKKCMFWRVLGEIRNVAFAIAS